MDVCSVANMLRLSTVEDYLLKTRQKGQGVADSIITIQQQLFRDLTLNND